VSNLFSKLGPARGNSRRGEGQLVIKFSISDFGFANDGRIVPSIKNRHWEIKNEF
jgi:hypothetical protein